MRGPRIRAGALFCLIVLCLPSLPASRTASASNASLSGTDDALTWAAPGNMGSFVHKVTGGQAVCVEADHDQARSLKNRLRMPFTVLSPDSDPSRSQRPALKIILRGTSQLQTFPGAIEALKRAAARWETQIRTAATIAIDVDFGPTLFGGRFDGDVVAATDSQVLAGNSLYPALRANLALGPYSPGQISLYTSLPEKSVPTDRGASTGLTASTANLRALEVNQPIALPEEEFADFGPPPAIGFNSAFKFDFDPNDGIDGDKFDFEAMALHEMGHVLGLISSVGQQEMNPSMPVEPSLWDLFRVRPEILNNAFTTADRILSSGGEQSFYEIETNVALSTGRPDGTGGDGRQASHWKDDSLTGRYVGVMDPSIATGEYRFLTDDDLTGLESIGYRVKSLGDPTIVAPLSSGVAQRGDIFAPPLPGLGFLSHLHYSILVPPGASQLRIDLVGNQDVDLFVRFGQPVFNNGHSPVADFRSATPSGSESVTVMPSGSRPLHQGIYYMAVANFGPGEANFTVTVTVTGGNITHPPTIFNAGGRLEGDVLGVNCAAMDRDGDFVSAEVSILNDAAQPVGSPSTVALNSAGATHIESQLRISGLNAIPAARMARVVLTDRSGNRSAEAIIDLGKGDAGGLALSTASYEGGKLTLKVHGPATDLQVEINGRVIAPPRRIKVNGSGSKLTIKGDVGQLALQPGPNRIRVKNLNGWSNIVILSI